MAIASATTGSSGCRCSRLFGGRGGAARPRDLVVLDESGGEGPTESPTAPFVSTGALPPAGARAAVVARRTRASRRSPTARVSRSIRRSRAVPGRPLRHLRRGDERRRLTPPGTPSAEFTIMSVSKPFVFALVCEARAGRGSPTARRQRHRAAVQLARRRSSGAADGRTNPMVNPGAIATDEPRPGRRPPRRAVGAHPRRAVALRRPHARRSTRRSTRPPRRPTTATASIAAAARRATAASTATRPRRSTSTPGSARLT